MNFRGLSTVQAASHLPHSQPRAEEPTSDTISKRTPLLPFPFAVSTHWVMIISSMLEGLIEAMP